MNRLPISQEREGIGERRGAVVRGGTLDRSFGGFRIENRGKVRRGTDVGV